MKDSLFVRLRFVEFFINFRFPRRVEIYIYSTSGVKFSRKFSRALSLLTLLLLYYSKPHNLVLVYSKVETKV